VSKNTFLFVFVAFLAAVDAAGQMMDYSKPWSAGAMTSNGQPVVGEIRNLYGNGSDLVVVLNSVTSARPLQQVPVDGSGTFELGSVPPGAYVVRLVHQPSDVILEEVVQLGAGQSLVLQLPQKAAEAKGATISTDQLQHPLSPKGAKMIRKAQNYAEAGDHFKAIEELKHALAEPTAAVYAHSLLGTEYLKTGQVTSAETELERAVQMLPHDAALHSNLGYALLLKGDRDRGEQEVRKALELDPNNSPAQRLLGFILKSRGVPH
jgi:tetratricopeptide (TPR) repeat protein